MVTAMLGVSWLAVLVCAVVLMVVGFVWYTVFANRWSAYTGWSREKAAQGPRNQMILNYVITFVAGFISWRNHLKAA